MKQLSPEAQAIVDAARAADVPAGERDRIKQSVLLRVSAAAIAISSASTTSSASAGTATLLGSAMGAKAGVAWLIASLALGGAAAVGVVQWNDRHHAAVPPSHLGAAPVNEAAARQIATSNVGLSAHDPSPPPTIGAPTLSPAPLANREPTTPSRP